MGAVIALLHVYIFQHFRCIDLSFQLEELKQKQAQAAALNSELKLNIATLSRPSRIDQIARLRLGLTQPLPDQVREYDRAEWRASGFRAVYARESRAVGASFLPSRRSRRETGNEIEFGGNSVRPGT